jgi:serine/threonine protein phosphatase 1
MTAPVAILPWRPASFALGDETVFAIGDIHGCARELAALLDAIADAATAVGRNRRTRLVYLGDMIDRGPDNVGVLKLWAEAPARRGVDRIDRLMGNHEQLLMLALADGHPDRDKAHAMWLSQRMGGGIALEQICAAAGRPGEGLSRDLLARVLGASAVAALDAMASHVGLGNALFVHGGLDPALDAAELLARPWTAFTDARWAWVHREFLEWRGGFGGRIVVHGHTPPKMHFEITGQADPHELMFDRLGLDGGTTVAGFVTGAQIETGRYRILRAGAAPAFS